MTDLGIPIPTKQSPYYCVNCGAHHAPNPATLPATAAEVAALRTSLRETDDHIQELADRIIALEAKRKK